MDLVTDPKLLTQIFIELIQLYTDKYLLQRDFNYKYPAVHPAWKKVCISEDIRIAMLIHASKLNIRDYYKGSLGYPCK